MITYPVVILLAVAISLIGNPANADTMNSPRVPRNLGIAGVMVAILIAGVSALRWQVGTDYSAYYRAFDKYLDEAAHDLSLTGEPGIKWIAFVSNLLGGVERRC